MKECPFEKGKMTPDEIEQIMNSNSLIGGKIIYVDENIFSEKIFSKKIFSEKTFPKVYSFKLESDKLTQYNISNSQNNTVLFDEYEKDNININKTIFSVISKNSSRINYIKSEVFVGIDLVIIFSIENKVIIFCRYCAFDKIKNYYKMKISLVFKFKELDENMVIKMKQEISNLKCLQDYIKAKPIIFNGEDYLILDENMKGNEINIEMNDNYKTIICNKNNKNYFECKEKDGYVQCLELYKKNKKPIYKKKTCQGIKYIKLSSKKENNNIQNLSEIQNNTFNNIENNDDDTEEKEVNDEEEKTDENTNQNDEIILNINHDDIPSSNSNSINNSVNNLEGINALKKKLKKGDLNGNQYSKNYKNVQNNNFSLNIKNNNDNLTVKSKNNNKLEYSDNIPNNQIDQHKNKYPNEKYYNHQYMEHTPYGGEYSDNNFPKFGNNFNPYYYPPYSNDLGINYNKGSQYNCYQNNGSCFNGMSGSNYINNSVHISYFK